ncbi:MAG: radical SAM protein [Lachnospiraceae bacterium]|nr:radical SAM protein [Lachnospiraceae bacterium]
MLKEISIEIIRKCPNNCLHCSSLSTEYCNEVLDYELFVSVVRNAAELGAKTICLSGGEPFLHSKLIEMVKFVASLGLETFIYTSGIVLDEQRQRMCIGEDILAAISKDVTKLIFNIEAAAPQTYDTIMGTIGCFEIMKQSVRNACKMNITTEAHFVPMKLNIREVKGVIALCDELHISKLSFLRLVLHGRAQLNEMEIALSDEELKQFKQLLGELQEQAEIDIRIGVPLSIDTECHKCEAAKGKLNIKYDGKVFPCEVFKNERMSHCLKEMKPESIYEKSLVDIYTNSPYLTLVRELEQEFLCTGECEACIGQYLISKEGK